MAVNDFTFNQLATVLNAIVQQATGASALSNIDTKNFVTVAQETLKTAGYDPVMNAISQVLSKTIFSVRPYSRKFGGLKADAVRYGNHVRKIQAIDMEFEDEARLSLTTGYAIDQYVVNNPKALQTNFYGENIFMKSITIYKDQLDSAMSGPEQFGEFLTMIMRNASDQIEQAHESIARATLANFIAGKITGDTSNVIHLVTEYNTVLGTPSPALTLADLYAPDKYRAFMQWVYARVNTISKLMTERSQKFHMNITGKAISRHTPVANQKVYILDKFKAEIEAMAKADTFHDNYLKDADNEGVGFWQAIGSPDSIKVKPIYLDVSTGGLTAVSGSPIDKSNVFGVIFDEEAVGYTTINESVDITPYNAKGKYWNQFWHFTDRYWNDFTENGVVLLLD